MLWKSVIGLNLFKTSFLHKNLQMGSKLDVKEIRIGLFPAEFSDQLSPTSTANKKQTTNDSFRSVTSTTDSNQILVESLTCNRHGLWQPSNSADMNNSIVSALKKRYKQKDIQLTIKTITTQFEPKLKDFRHFTNGTELDIGPNRTTTNKRHWDTFDTSETIIDGDYRDEPVNKISKPTVGFDHRSSSPFQSYKPQPNYKRRYVEFVDDGDLTDLSPESKRLKVNDINVSFECRAIPLSVEEINRIDEPIIPHRDFVVASSSSANKNLSTRLQLPIYQKLKRKQVNNSDVSMAEEEDVVDKNDVEKMKQFHQNCARKWFSTGSSVGSAVPLRSILKKSSPSLQSGSTTVTVNAISAPIFSSVELVSKPSSVVLPQSSSAISLSSIAPATSTNTIGGFTTTFPISTTVSTTNSNFLFTNTPSIPSSFEFGMSNVASAFPAGNLFAIGNTPTATKATTAVSRRKRR